MSERVRFMTTIGIALKLPNKAIWERNEKITC
jgi:hypothetical protein